MTAFNGAVYHFEALIDSSIEFIFGAYRTVAKKSARRTVAQGAAQFPRLLTLLQKIPLDFQALVCPLITWCFLPLS
jgi:hypothetical protein